MTKDIIMQYLEELGKVFSMLFSKLEYVFMVYEKEDKSEGREVYFVTNAKNKMNIISAVSALPDMAPKSKSSYPVELPHRN